MPKGYSEYNQGGWRHTEEAKQKVRMARLGTTMLEEVRSRLRGPRGPYHSEEFKQQLSARMTGTGNPMYGKPNTPEMKAKISAALKGRFAGDKNPMFGRNGANHPNWKGGIAYLPYAPEFTKELRERIRQRDGYRCQECGISQSELTCPLSPHHIDYDKRNSSEYNLISLCEICHGKTNYSRAYWQRHFEEKIATIYMPKGES